MSDGLAGKPLPEALQEIGSGTLVYLGAQSSFFDIALSNELRKDEYLENLSHSLEQGWNSRADTAREKFLHALMHPPGWEKPKESEKYEKSITEYIDMMSHYHNRLRTMRDTAQKAKSFSERFVPLKDRKVKSAYPRLDGTGICVIVLGEEVGGYWMLSEKENGKEAVVQDEGKVEECPQGYGTDPARDGG